MLAPHDRQVAAEIVGQAFLPAFRRRRKVVYMRDSDFSILQRKLPHWRLDGATYFITFRLPRGEFSLDEILLVKNHIVSGNGRFYELLAVMVMPDHVHAMLCPKDGMNLSRITKRMKGVSARLINQARKTSGALWQDESWDRIVRDHDELVNELDYMFENPSRKGLIDDPAKWPGWWCSAEYV
jgi:putative transposase